ncbi:S-layer homology domain-containing protein [Lysinibacillus sp. NPDC097231]|uniref:S-layer homology domain-containing protein n=1 Tax=Lysinibacillus sp. NPDC097231 TaxID=3364142 RepID=UPI0038041FC6
MKKQIKVAAISTLLLSTLAVPTVSYAKETVAVNVQANVKFTDVDKKHYAYDAILWAQQRGIVSGYTDSNGKPNGKFGPNDSVTEAQFAKMLAEFYGFKDDKGKLNNFTPTPLWSDTYYDALATYGVPLNGYFDSGLRNKSVKRGVVAQAIGHLSGNANSLTDSINYMIGEGITTGQNPQYENSDLLKYFGSNNTLTRAQVVAFLYRMDSNSIKNAGVLAKDVHSNKEGLALAALANNGISKLDSSLKLGSSASETSGGNTNIANEEIDSTYGGKVTIYGDNIKFTPGSQSGDIDKIKEDRKSYTGEFTKEITTANKQLVEKLPTNLDYKTFENGTYIFDKNKNEKVIFAFINSGTTIAKKGEFGYYINTTIVDRNYLESSQKNLLNVYEMVRNSGYKLTDEEIKSGIAKAIENDGDYFKFGDYSFAADFNNIIQISKIN